MSKHKILIVEPDDETRNLLDIYFTGQGHDVSCLQNISGAVESAIDFNPNLILLADSDDYDGVELLKSLRTTQKTKHIPIVVMSHKQEKEDKLPYFEMGADDYIIKPFDIEELRLRVNSAIKVIVDDFSENAISGFPRGQLIEKHLLHLMRKGADWSYIDIKISNFESFAYVYGWKAGDEVVRATALMIRDILKEHGLENDFAGHPRHENFVIISHAESTEKMIEALKKRFNTEIQEHYPSTDREWGYMLVGDEKNDLMTLATGSVSTRTHQFADIREIHELAVADRRRKSGKDDEPPILTAW